MSSTGCGRPTSRPLPPRTTIGVGEGGLEVPGALVAVDVIAARAGGDAHPEPISSGRIPRPIANYTPATRYGDLIFLAGQLPSDFADGGVPTAIRTNAEYPYHSSALELQTEFTLNNLKLLLEDAGSDLAHVVKAQVFLKDLNDFSAFDDVWRRAFPRRRREPPYRSPNLLVGTRRLRST